MWSGFQGCDRARDLGDKGGLQLPSRRKLCTLRVLRVGVHGAGPESWGTGHLVRSRQGEGAARGSSSTGGTWCPFQCAPTSTRHRHIVERHKKGTSVCLALWKPLCIAPLLPPAGHRQRPVTCAPTSLAFGTAASAWWPRELCSWQAAGTGIPATGFVLYHQKALQQQCAEIV